MYAPQGHSYHKKTSPHLFWPLTHLQWPLQLNWTWQPTLPCNALHRFLCTHVPWQTLLSEWHPALELAKNLQMTLSCSFQWSIWVSLALSQSQPFFWRQLYHCQRKTVLWPQPPPHLSQLPLFTRLQISTLFTPLANLQWFCPHMWLLHQMYSLLFQSWCCRPIYVSRQCYLPCREQCPPPSFRWWVIDHQMHSWFTSVKNINHVLAFVFSFYVFQKKKKKTKKKKTKKKKAFFLNFLISSSPLITLFITFNIYIYILSITYSEII
jgi:hypothetical protein